DTAKSETHRFTTASSPYYEEEEVRVLMQNRPNNGVNLVFLCDGFVIDDLERGGECDRIVEEALNYFFDIEPYKSYQDYFNAYVVYSFSAEKGASYGTVNTLKNTSFSLTCDKESPSSTNMSCDSVKVFNYAKKAPIGPVNQTTIIVIAQEERYAGTTYMWWGGSSEWGGGKSIALLTTSQNNYPYNFKGTLQHEAGGHAFAKLADEYVNDETAKNRSRDDLVNSYTNYGIYSNVDVTSDLSLIRWKDFIGLPHYEDVGAYEGGYYFATGVWRPEPGSCMINNIAYYNAPSRAAIVRRLKTIAKETFDFEDFLANDHVTSLPAFAPDPPTKLQAYLYLAPPVLIRE
ncbi:MAG: M64 family metallopeptidase, partial [Bacteroidetes bacterium]|nr:M64 family metallopeptidase [Bacteroidota bacterium]